MLIRKLFRLACSEIDEDLYGSSGNQQIRKFQKEEDEVTDTSNKNSIDRRSDQEK